MVFVTDEKKKRLERPMAKIIELKLVRPLQRLVPLELKSTETDLSNRPDVVKKSVDLHKETSSKAKTVIPKKAVNVQLNNVRVKVVFNKFSLQIYQNSHVSSRISFNIGRTT